MDLITRVIFTLAIASFIWMSGNTKQQFSFAGY